MDDAMIEAVRLAYDQARESMGASWDDEAIEGIVDLFKSGFRTEIMRDEYGFWIIPEDSAQFRVEMKEYRYTVFVQAVFPHADGFLVAHSSMVSNQKKARIIFERALDALTTP